MRVTARFVGADVVVVAGAAVAGTPAVVAVAALCVVLELLVHTASPTATTRLIARRPWRRQTGISAHRNREGSSTNESLSRSPEPRGRFGLRRASFEPSRGPGELVRGLRQRRLFVIGG